MYFCIAVFALFLLGVVCADGTVRIEFVSNL